MKKLLFVLISVLFLTACGFEVEENEEEGTEEIESKTEEVEGEPLEGFDITEEAIRERDEFIAAFNDYADSTEFGVPEISHSDIQEIRNEEDSYKQLIHDEEEEINVKYNENGELIGYEIAFHNDSEDSVVYASLIPKALDLDMFNLTERISETFETDEEVYSDKYTENEYEVSLVYATSLGYYIINFNKNN
ncbi:hypothetical protein SAMN04487943_101313 [Gracilibacillus orientalis]|uniref:YusW-like protein n=1 Tax=Gracilibacillus orientalis TaxID=334253 RepID=A0A1I4HBQ8_9BACI|nr:hypothetical protein [Gracilibacillus orientalis]SFL39113.1 hypothetical protein SAMN04487943_101313 [Gracilibacillus orientalis]